MKGAKLLPLSIHKMLAGSVLVSQYQYIEYFLLMQV
jgi:hypothetical protein